MPQHFPEFDPADAYRGALMLATDAEGRYRSQCIERAIRVDDHSAIKEAVELGWLVPACRSLFNQTIPAYCEMRNAHRCAKALIDLGFA